MKKKIQTIECPYCTEDNGYTSDMDILEGIQEFIINDGEMTVVTEPCYFYYCPLCKGEVDELVYDTSYFED